MTESENNLPRDLQHPGGFVEATMDWINATAVCPQPIFALASALCLAGTLYGRHVKDESGQRTNIYVMGVGRERHGREGVRLPAPCAQARPSGAVELRGRTVERQAARPQGRQGGGARRDRQPARVPVRHDAAADFFRRRLQDGLAGRLARAELVLHLEDASEAALHAGGGHPLPRAGGGADVEGRAGGGAHGAVRGRRAGRVRGVQRRHLPQDDKGRQVGRRDELPLRQGAGERPPGGAHPRRGAKRPRGRHHRGRRRLRLPSREVPRGRPHPRREGDRGREQRRKGEEAHPPDRRGVRGRGNLQARPHAQDPVHPQVVPRRVRGRPRGERRACREVWRKRRGGLLSRRLRRVPTRQNTSRLFKVFHANVKKVQGTSTRKRPRNA